MRLKCIGYQRRWRDETLVWSPRLGGGFVVKDECGVVERLLKGEPVESIARSFTDAGNQDVDATFAELCELAREMISIGICQVAE